jgi:hypothetical protein
MSYNSEFLGNGGSNGYGFRSNPYSQRQLDGPMYNSFGGILPQTEEREQPSFVMNTYMFIKKNRYSIGLSTSVIVALFLINRNRKIRESKEKQDLATIDLATAKKMKMTMNDQIIALQKATEANNTIEMLRVNSEMERDLDGWQNLWSDEQIKMATDLDVTQQKELLSIRKAKLKEELTNGTTGGSTS